MDQKPEVLTLSEAVDVLNRVKHNGYNSWAIGRYEDQIWVQYHPFYRDNEPTPFEAIAIAEKYLRLSDDEIVLLQLGKNPF